MLRVRPSRHVQSAPRGFTLIEIVMVMAVIGLLVAIVAPKINLAKIRLDAGMQSLNSVMLAAQRLAVSRQHDVQVLFDESGNRLRIREDVDNDGTLDTGERERVVPLAEGVAFSKGGAPNFPGAGAVIGFAVVASGLPGVVFHRNGAASEATGFYITSAVSANTGSRPEDTRYLRVERATGRVAWFRYTGTAWVEGS